MRSFQLWPNVALSIEDRQAVIIHRILPILLAHGPRCDFLFPALVSAFSFRTRQNFLILALRLRRQARQVLAARIFLFGSRLCHFFMISTSNNTPPPIASNSASLRVIFRDAAS